MYLTLEHVGVYQLIYGSEKDRFVQLFPDRKDPQECHYLYGRHIQLDHTWGNEHMVNWNNIIKLNGAREAWVKEIFSTGKYIKFEDFKWDPKHELFLI